MTANIPQDKFDPLLREWKGTAHTTGSITTFDTPPPPPLVVAPPTPVVEAEVSVAPVEDAPYKVTDQNLIVNNGGGHRTHYSIWVDKNGTEYIYIAGIQLTRISDLNLPKATREKVVRR